MAPPLDGWPPFRQSCKAMRSATAICKSSAMRSAKAICENSAPGRETKDIGIEVRKATDTDVIIVLQLHAHHCC
jgi:hypothetical protein